MAKKKEIEYFDVDKWWKESHLESKPVYPVYTNRTKMTETFLPKYRGYFSPLKILRNNNQF